MNAASTILIVTLILGSTMMVPGVPNTGVRTGQVPIGETNDTGESGWNISDPTGFVTSESSSGPLTGTLDPVLIEQSGYSTSGNISAGTDSHVNLKYDLPLDSDHGWVADQVDLSLWNLQKLYAVNGSFDSGVPGINVIPTGNATYHPIGWDAMSNDTDTYSDDLQMAAYEDTGSKYVTVRSQGGKTGQNGYTHVQGTKIIWTQTVQNSPYTEDFTFNLDYFYLNGPIDGPTGNDDIAGNASLVLLVDGVVVWNMSLLLISQRGVWLNTGDVSVSVPSAPSSFTLGVGIVVDETMYLSKNADYDGDSEHLPDGIDNAAYITLYLDDVSLVRATPPTASQVDLQCSIGSQSSAFTGSAGVFNTSIINESYWKSSPVSITLSANTSVSFEYEARLASHYFTNSSWTTDVSSHGVSYTVDSGASPQICFYAYVGYLGNYEDPSMTIVYPADWENATVSDPFLFDRTLYCTITTGSITVPSTIIDNLGWWEFRIESPNYARTLRTDVHDTDWVESGVFRIGNETRAAVEIGTATEVIDPLSNVNVTWFNPDNVVWHSELLAGGVNGAANGSAWTFESSSSPAGEWSITVSWTNGSEIAFARTVFEVHHSTALLAEYPVIEVIAGQTVNALVRYTDTENGNYLMDSAASMVGNWSSGPVVFQPNPVNNWWETSLSTKDSGAGRFVVEVTVSRPYYDNASCQILVEAKYDTRLSSPDAPWTSAEWGSVKEIAFFFEVYDFDTEDWVPMDDPSGLDMSVNWTEGYWTFVGDVNPGVYTLEVNTSSLLSGDYLLNVTFDNRDSKLSQMTLTLVVAPMTTRLEISGSSFETTGLAEAYNTTFTYEMLNGTGIQGADVEIVHTGPTMGLAWNIVESGEGNYSVEFIPSLSGTYMITIAASLQHYQSASDAFFLNVESIGTELTVLNGTADTVNYGASYELWIHYTNSSGFGLDNASVSVIDLAPETGLSWDSATPRGDGFFSLTLHPDDADTFTLTLRVNLTNHQTQFATFTLTATAIATSLTVLNASTSIAVDQSFDIYFLYQSADLTGLENATLEVQNPRAELVFSDFEDLSNGYYRVNVESLSTGIFDIVFRASLAGYQADVESFTLGVTRIPTVLRVEGGMSSDSVVFSAVYPLRLYFERTDQPTNITGAAIEVSSYPDSGLNVTIQGMGSGYEVLVNASRVGRWTITVTAQKENYASALIEFVLEVEPLTIKVLVLSGASGYEGAETDIVVQLTDALNGDPVIGADVSYRVSKTRSGDFIPMEETDTPGVYSAKYGIPLADESEAYILEVRVQKDNYEVPTGVQSEVFTIIPNLPNRMMPILATGGSGIGIIVFLVVGWKTYQTRKKRKILAGLQVRRRFDDASNILGVLVLHKKSGLPVYSKILRGGFEEAMVSAFITAITHFRSEFQMDEKHWEFNVIPISDIISAVPTKNLIVAFITVRPPSKYQEISMEAYGRAVGALFDESADTSKPRGISREQTQVLTNLYFDLMDGFLLEKYRLNHKTPAPKSMKCLVTTASQLESDDGFRLEDLARGISTCGVEETFAYKMIMDAVEDGMLTVVNGEVKNGIESPVIDKVKKQMMEEMAKDRDPEY
ncbi:MAG: hypothetical protein ACP6KW_06590 [Candidatus Thorarchaeota archaeon]